MFALIIVGHILRRTQFPGDTFWPSADRINYFLFFPCLLIGSLVKAPLNSPGLLQLGLAVILIMGIAWIILLIMKRIYRWPAARFGALTQGILRFNTYIGLAATGSLFGEQGLGLAALIIAVMVPTINIMSVWALCAERGISLRALMLPILRNPLILSCFVGVLLNFSGWGLPGGIDSLFGLMAAASLPLGLLSVGAALLPEKLAAEISTLSWNSALRLIAMPALAFMVARLLHLPTLESQLLVLFCALPTAPSSYVLARQLGGDYSLMAGIITLQTLLATLSLLLVLHFLVL